MPKHKSEDYKIVTVKHYLANKTSYTETCRIFKCSERSLKRWIEKYKKKGSIERYNRKPISYKITEKQVKYSLDALKMNEQITMVELAKIVKKKYKNFDITPQHLGKIIRDNNKTRKRTTHEHFPTTRYNKIIDKKKELNKFYKKISSYQLNKIISLDETSIQPSMLMEYSRCELGRRRIVKTSDSYLFRKLTLLVAINIYKIAYNAIHGKERPKYLSRSTVIRSTPSVGKLPCHS